MLEHICESYMLYGYTMYIPQVNKERVYMEQMQQPVGTLYYVWILSIGGEYNEHLSGSMQKLYEMAVTMTDPVFHQAHTDNSMYMTLYDQGLGTPDYYDWVDHVTSE